MLEAPTWGPEKEGRQGTGRPGLSPLGAPSGAMSLAPPTRAPRFQWRQVGALRTAQTLGWAAPLAPSILHSTYEILGNLTSSLSRSCGKQWPSIRQPSPAFPQFPSVQETLTLQPSGQGSALGCPPPPPCEQRQLPAVWTPAVGAVWPPFWAVLGSGVESGARGAGGRSPAQHCTSREWLDRHPGAAAGATGDRV